MGTGGPEAAAIRGTGLRGWQELAGRAGWCGGWDQVIEEPVVFVVVDEHDRGRRQFGVGPDRIEHGLHVRRAIDRSAQRVLAVQVRSHDPRDRRQRVVLAIGDEL